MSKRARQETSGLERLIDGHLEAYFSALGDTVPPPDFYHMVLPMLERPLITRMLTANAGNQLRTAEALGINRNTLRKKITELGIDIEDVVEA